MWRWGGDIAHGLVPVHQVLPYFIEGVNRVGRAEFARRIEIATENLSKILDGKRRSVRKETVRRCLLEVISIRRKNEVRHRDSISRGVNMRGEPEKKVTAREHLYRPHGDIDAELKRRNVREISEKKAEEIRAKDRERKKSGKQAQVA
jgi:hypothetical protein